MTEEKDSEPYPNETYEQWHSRTGKLPPFYDPIKNIDAQHRFARAPLEAVRRLRERRAMEEADRKARMRAAMLMTGLMMIHTVMR